MARTSPRTNRRRGGEREEPVTGRGSRASFLGYGRHRRRSSLPHLVSLPGLAWPYSNVELIEVDGRPFHMNPGKGAR